MVLGFCIGRAASGRAPADCAISIEYFSELQNHVPGNWEVLVRENHSNNLSFSISFIIGIFSLCRDFPILNT